MIRNNIATYAATVGGGLLVVIGLIGFCFPTFLGAQANSSVVYNLVHLVSGVLALTFGLKSGSLAGLRNFCFATGVLYCLAGLAGFVVGGLGNMLVHVMAGAGFLAAAIIQPSPPAAYAPR